jgi:lipoate---protein ligase
MKYIDLTLPSPAENLAFDEALLDLCDEGVGGEVLRFWESPQYFVVLGYGNHAATEVHLERCKTAGIPVLRRVTGGGTVLQGPGCLNYGLVLRIEQSSPLATITGANRVIMEKQKVAMQTLVEGMVEIEGYTDLAVGGLKFSGNAQRRKRRALIFHGSILLKFDLLRIEECLKMPSKQPCYRRNRSHGEFLAKLELDSKSVKQAIQREWDATEELKEVPVERIKVLSGGKYSSEEWNLKF